MENNRKTFFAVFCLLFVFWLVSSTQDLFMAFFSGFTFEDAQQLYGTSA